MLQILSSIIDFIYFIIQQIIFIFTTALQFITSIPTYFELLMSFTNSVPSYARACVGAVLTYYVLSKIIAESKGDL